MNQKMLILVDASNLFYSANYAFGYGARVDFRKLEFALIDGRPVSVKTVAFFTSYRDDITNVVNMLQMFGIETRVQKIKKKDKLRGLSGLSGTDTDVSLATEAMLHAPKADIVAVASGDGDFLPLYQALRAMGKRVEVALFPNSGNPNIVGAVDRVVELGAEVLWRGGVSHVAAT